MCTLGFHVKTLWDLLAATGEFHFLFFMQKPFSSFLGGAANAKSPFSKKQRRKVKNKPGAFEYRFGLRDINYHGNGFCSSEGNVKHQIGSKYSVFFKVCFLLGG